MEYESVVTNATALQGILASPKDWKNGDTKVENSKHFAQCAVNFADCLEVELTDGDYEDYYEPEDAQ